MALALRGADALLVRSRARVTAAVLASADRLKVIGRGGVGLENIDLEAATARNIAVVYTPEAATDSVADLTVGMMISLVRKIGLGDAMVRSGDFDEARTACMGRELRELTLGIVGLGRIGRAVARRCRHGFGMRVLYNDIVDPGYVDFSAEAVDKRELYGRSDVVSLHVPLTRQTRHLIRESTLLEFKPGAMLINTARGAVLDGPAVAKALSAGVLGGLAIDVFDPEPPPDDDPLREAPNTLLVPHLGSRTVAGLSRMNDVVEDVIAVLQGRPPQFPAEQV